MAVNNNSSWTVGNGGTTGKGVGYTDKNTEIERTKSVLQHRTSQGMDTSAQQQWYKKLTGNDWSAPQQNTQNSFSNNTQGISNNQNQFKFQTYDANNYVANDTYLNKAKEFQIGATVNQPYSGFQGNQYQAGSLLDQNGLNELAYYLQLQDDIGGKAGSAYTNAMQQEIGKGTGLSNDWANNYTDVQDIYKQQWALQDFLADKYGVNGQNDLNVKGLSRADLGFLEGGTNNTLEERLATGQVENPWGINSNYFNDPRNKGQQFAYMNYFDPTAYAWQNAGAEDGRSSEYFYNTNFAREHGYVDDKWDYNINNFADWRDLSHNEFVDKYGVGGANWGGNEANLQSYQNMLNQILSGTYNSSGGATSPTPAPSTSTKPTTSKDTTTPSKNTTSAKEKEAVKEEETLRALQRYLNGMWGGGY